MGIFTLTPIPIGRIKSIFMTRKAILKQEGFVSLLKNLFSTFLGLLFSYEHFYLYRYRLDPSMEIPLVPCKVDSLVMKPIFLPISLQEYELLGTQGFDFSTHPKAQEYKKGLGNGTIVFYTSNDNGLVNRTGMTTYRNGVYQYVYPSYLDKGNTVYAGFSETNKEHRLKGVYTYVHSEIYRYLREAGFSEVILLESKEQIGPRKAQERLGAEVLRESYHLRLLFLLNLRWNRPNLYKHPN